MAAEESSNSGGNTDPPPIAEDGAAPEEAPVPPPDTDMASDTDSAATKEADDDDEEEGSKDDDDAVVGDDDAPAGDDDDTSPDELLVRAASLKEEGNALFKAGDLDRSARAYRKGTNLLKKLNAANTGDAQVKALLITLQTNLSMVCHRHGKHRMSRDVAARALAIDGANVKALYRRAVAHRALGDLDAARADLRAAVAVEPQNASVKRELAGVRKALDVQRRGEMARLQKAFSGKGSLLYSDKEEEERRRARQKAAGKKAAAEAKEKRKREWEDECVERMASDPPKEAVSFDEWDKARTQKEEEAEKARKKAEKERKREERRRKNAASAATADDKGAESDDDELTEKELAMLRGYKKTSDGRTTSYFNREQTAREKELIGSIAPKRLEEPAAASPTGGPLGSVWNQAGTTWEEKDTTDWCKQTLERCLLETTTAYCASATAPAATYVAVVKKVSEVAGDASVALAGGKTRYIYDFRVGVEYEVRDDGGALAAAGALRLPDVNSATTADAAALEVEVPAWTQVPGEGAAQDASECRRLLIQDVRQSVLGFVEKFNTNF